MVVMVLYMVGVDCTLRMSAGSMDPIAGEAELGGLAVRF